MKNILKMLLVFILSLCCVACGGNGENNEEQKKESVIDELKSFTVYEEDDGICSFKYNQDSIAWILNYSSENDFVRFYDDNLANIFINYFQIDCFGNDEYKGFSYDLSEKEANIYFDSDTIGLSIIIYNFDEDQFTIMKDGELYNVSDDFMEFAENNDISGILKKDVSKFEDVLNENDISLNDISSITYDEVMKD